MKTVYATGELCQMFGLAGWKIRKAVDALPSGVICKVGGYRVVPAAALPTLTAEIQRRGWLTPEPATND